ncbi:contractile injection system protein, VgrG/Pvc8 family [Phaeobacter porticola]|uniref:Putative phage late control gene D protein n=1 Tax=Phaeobacter porticola TaxID=1844006 RepID=A0A1L3I5I6_9RHOB|nr:contractile injection system protein, VgrG/Pvc8 family [Phaeobacter porticola]APG47410.1 putative phage late control gene D protein [Phaeobacter porticola]
MKVAYQTIADGEDVTGNFADRLIGLTVIDEAGSKSDRAEITVDDRDDAIALPEDGVALQISLGFTSDLVEIGRFVVDELSGSIAPDIMTIGAKAADMLSGIRARKSRSWRNVSLADIITKIAGEHGLKPVISDSLKAHRYAYLAQTTESDLNFLTRLAKDLDAVAKPAGGALVVAKRGENKAADGSALPVFEVNRAQMASCDWQLKGRGKYGCVIVEWTDLGSAEIRTCKAGDKDPKLKLRHRYPNKAEAQRAADAALSRAARASGSVSVQLGGFWGDLMAEAKVNLTGIKPELEGEWLITSVTHRLGAALTTSFKAERDNEKTKT